MNFKVISSTNLTGSQKAFGTWYKTVISSSTVQTLPSYSYVGLETLGSFIPVKTTPEPGYTVPATVGGFGTATLLPNIFYKLGICGALAISTLSTPTGNNANTTRYNEFMIEVTASS